jgi:excinuclease ABC subunit A
VTIASIEDSRVIHQNSDWLIDLRPEGGDDEIVAWGPPEDIVRAPRSYTGKFLGPVLANAGKRKRGASEAAE